ncbi:type II toxin-antitoxin system HicA family toxin [Oceanicella sp. SM1341]|uniref:type II toxin-antitoxin system HicA family toxin n=1 Tax=Oceanicella sp. SM1341 TaxID=1548889 RepID=UPI000E542CED|nr:type II toxin-antitoxin system HicA family toxin [Oceanicella sp. SM1341]
MNSKELEKLLRRLGATFENHKGGSGHRTVRLNGKTSQLPRHGSRKELGTNLVEKIKKDLGVK